jgi:DNA adenine methylase
VFLWVIGKGLAHLALGMAMAKNAAALAEPCRASSRSGQCAILSTPNLALRQSNDARPFLKWAGGKTRLLSSLLPYVPQRFANYHEPFLGGGAMFFKVRSLARERCYLADLNDELVNTWLVVKTQSNKLFAALNAYIGRDSRRDYCKIRAKVPADRVARAARFIYLNQTSWNGLWRVNRWGIFNVPWGVRPFRGVQSDDLKAVSQALKNVVIQRSDFRSSLETPKAGDFVYLDPPYLPISDTSKFSGYTERRFRAPDLVELSEACRSLTKRGVRWLLSNRDNERVRDLFDHARIASLTVRRSVAAQNRRDVQPIDSPEVIIVGGPKA